MVAVTKAIYPVSAEHSQCRISHLQMPPVRLRMTSSFFNPNSLLEPFFPGESIRVSCQSLSSGCTTAASPEEHYSPAAYERDTNRFSAVVPLKCHKAAGFRSLHSFPGHATRKATGSRQRNSIGLRASFEKSSRQGLWKQAELISRPRKLVSSLKPLPIASPFPLAVYFTFPHSSSPLTQSSLSSGAGRCPSLKPGGVPA